MSSQNIFIKSKKIISSLLILSLILSGVVFVKPEQSYAQIPVTDVAQIGVLTGFIIPILMGAEPGEAQKEGGIFGLGWDGVFYASMNILLRQLSQSIVDWINSGFEGNPSFVQDPEKFMLGVADRTIGEFIFNDPDLNFLCEPFRINVKLSLGLQYSPFQDKINCTLSEVFGNSLEAYDKFVGGDFIGGGGWDSWLNITTNPQNNQIGAMLIAQAELDARIDGATANKERELSWGGGILSWKKCTTEIVNAKKEKIEDGPETTGDPYYDYSYNYTSALSQSLDEEARKTDEMLADLDEAETYTKRNCSIQTPGGLIEDQLKAVTKLDMDRLNLADEINEIAGALANFMITKVLEKGLAAVTKDDLSPDNGDWQAGILALRNQQNDDIERGNQSTAYQPNTASYTNPGGAQSIEEQKNTILVDLANWTAIERQYYDIYSSIAVSSQQVSSDAFTKVINCYSTKLSTPNLSNSKKDEANAQINQASSTMQLMNGYTITASTEMTESQTNLTTLNRLTSEANRAVTAATLNGIAIELLQLTTQLHTSNDLITANTWATGVTTEITSSGTSVATSATACAQFPN